LKQKNLNQDQEGDISVAISPDAIKVDDSYNEISPEKKLSAPEYEITDADIETVNNNKKL
jgi:hypothetical protein